MDEIERVIGADWHNSIAREHYLSGNGSATFRKKMMMQEEMEADYFCFCGDDDFEEEE